MSKKAEIKRVQRDLVKGNKMGIAKRSKSQISKLSKKIAKRRGHSILGSGYDRD